MRRIGVIAVGAALLGLLLFLRASRLPPGDPEAGPAPAWTPADADSSALESGAESAAETWLQAAPPPRRAATPSPQAGEPETAAAAAEAAPGSEPIPLEKLLSWEEPRPEPRGLDLGRAAQAGDAAAPDGPGVRDRVYIERRKDEIQPGDRERELETTDVGVRMPVGESVEVRSGVRVESRQDGETQVDEPTPTVGVGVRF